MGWPSRDCLGILLGQGAPGILCGPSGVALQNLQGALKNTLGLGTPGTFWGWALPANTLGDIFGVGHSRNFWELLGLGTSVILCKYSRDSLKGIVWGWALLGTQGFAGDTLWFGTPRRGG